ncbi:hypothetical protein [uncultured Winogradskyella sp.]|uniref:hypothetical protein n=1 Tax=uncultured Winogradskyella sp. TaxID=395353 RepID=UPI0030EE34B5|tara:strand:+ start:242 stop:442 length:201 start_codon:yes stop_codon:yes gene_type:complete
MKNLELNEMENIQGGEFTWGWECAVGILGVGFAIGAIIGSGGTAGALLTLGGGLTSVLGMAQSCDQ